jgi:hydrogenase maturation protein HypF
MKNTVALAWQNRLVVSPHIGDMGTARSLAVFEQTLRDLQSLYGVTATAVICDAHPGYATTRWAEYCGLPVHRVLHHHAHAAVTCLPDLAADNRLVFTWDGTGYGADGTLWGGEALLGQPGNWQRFASLRPFRLPGGERAGREPWRSAAAICWETGTDWSHLPDTAGLLRHAWERRINTPQTSAAGRLFDAAAALTGLCLEASHEGQGPMELEAACRTAGSPVELPLGKSSNDVWLTDWEPLLPMLLDSTHPAAERAACFHASMAAVLLRQARQARTDYGITRIGLSGGVFQNRILTERAVELLTDAGFHVTLPDDIPVNDAGISVGQIIEYAALHRSPDAA